MDLQKKYYELLNGASQGLSQIGNTVQNVATAVSNPNSQQRQQLNTQIKSTLAPIANAQVNAGRTIVGGLSSGLSSLGNQINKLPISNVPNSLTVGQTVTPYVQNRIIKPLSQQTDKQVSQNYQKDGLKALITPTLNTVGAAFNATPAGMAYSGVDAVKSGVQAFRKGQDISKAGVKGFTGENIIGAGDAVSDNPYVAMLGNVGEFGAGFVSPGMIKKGSAFAKGMVTQYNKQVAPNDAKEILTAVERYAMNKEDINYMVNQGGKDLKLLRQYAADYLAKEFKDPRKYSDKDMVQALLNRVRVDQNLPQITMGIKSNNRKGMNKSMENQLLGGQADMNQQGTPQIPTQLKGKGGKNPSLSQQDALPGMPGGLTSVPPSGSQSSSGSITKVPNSEKPYFNTNKYNITDANKGKLNQVIQEVKPQIEKVVGKKLSNKETIATAENSAKVLDQVVTREQTADYTARLLKTRQQLAKAANSGTVDKEYLDNLMIVKSQASDIARKLQSFGIGADPSTITSREAILDAVLKVEKDTTKLLKAAEGVDFNDLNQATDFYRKFVKPSKSEWLDTIRYNSMLSSPNTHINNAFSNMANTAIVAPIEKTLTGTIDFLSSKVTGKKQTQFAGEGAAYAKGYVKSIGDAAHAFADAMRGKTVTGNLDVRQIPLSTNKRMLSLTFPTKILEASDQFFTALTKGAEEAGLKYRASKGVKVTDITGKAMSNAKYRLFRSELKDPRQGLLLNGVDEVTGLIQRARNSDNILVSTIAKFTLPFVQTPMNILKQGIEYSPAGVLTMYKAPNKTEQLSKAILGSSAAAATAMLIASGRTTWAEPTDPTKKSAFRAAGLQPYSVKIGDYWVSYAKLPPALGFPIAFMSAIYDAQENQTIDQNQVDVLLTAAAKYGNFFADQSYLKNIGDLVATAKGSPEGMVRFISNYPQQLVPYRALMGWMARIIDPYQRQVNQDAGFLEKQVQQLFTQIPGLSMTVPARLDKLGNPIINNNKEFNAVSPLRVTKENEDNKGYYDLLKQKALFNKNENIMKEKILKGDDVTFQQTSASEGDTPLDIKAVDKINQRVEKGEISREAGDMYIKNLTPDPELNPNMSPQEKLKAKLEESTTRARVEMSGKPEEKNGVIYYQNQDGGVSSLSLNPPTKGKGIDAFANQNWNISKALDVYGSDIPQDMKNEAYKKLKVDGNDLEYAYKASKSVDVKVQYINSQNLSHDELIQRMLTGRVEGINGEQFASNGVIDKLNEQGKLSDYEAKQLKKMKFDKNGKSIAKASGSGRKIKLPKAKLVSLKIPKTKRVKAIKVKVSKVKQYKLSKIKLKAKLKS